MGNKKLQVWLPLIFAIVMIAGMLIGYQLQNPFHSRKNNSLEETLELIKQRYVDSVHLDSLQIGAIEQIMTRLDPHSVYFPPVELKEVNEELSGNLQGGIGVEFSIFNDTVNVIYVNPKGPGDVAGLQIGDKILKANDSSLTSRSFTTNEIKNLIRGERN